LKVVKVQKGKHRFRPLRLRLFLNKSRLAFSVCFNYTAKYDIGSNQSDINKLFGIGYLPGHHRNSARFGWRYNKDINKIDIFSYVYDSGKRKATFLCSIAINVPHVFILEISPIRNQYGFTVVQRNVNMIISSYDERVQHIPAIGYFLNSYFGGDETAPHDIDYTMNEV